MAPAPAPPDHLVNMVLDAAPEVGGNHQDDWQLRLPQQRGGDRETKRPDLIAADMTGYTVGIVRKSFGEQRLRSRVARLGGRTEADATLMKDEHIAGQAVVPAKRGGAQAKIVLLAVAKAKSLGVKNPHRVQRRSADIHAEAHGGRHVHPPAGIHHATSRIQLRYGLPECQRAGIEARIAADRGIVREG